MDAATVDRLANPPGRTLLAELATLPAAALDATAGLALATRLRRSHGADLVAAAMTLTAGRHRARDKLGGDAEVMVFDRVGLEQATRGVVAAHRATRLAGSAARTVVDLGCGIGSDLVALARAGLAVTGVDRDPARVAMARANLAALHLPGHVLESDAEAVVVTGYDAAFVDPSRRGGGGRTVDPTAWSLPWQLVEGLLGGSSDVQAVAKLAPGIAHRLVPAGVEAEWVSDGGDLVEAALWGAPLAGVRRRATLLPVGDTLTDADDPGPLPAGPMLAYLYEPDDAVTRAGLVTAAAALVDGRLVDPAAGLRHLRPAGRHGIPARLPRRRRAAVPRAGAALRERDVGSLTIKKRGVDVVPELLRRRLRLDGSVPATIVGTRVEGRAAVFLVEAVG